MWMEELWKGFILLYKVNPMFLKLNLFRNIPINIDEAMTNRTYGLTGQILALGKF